jgi:hypothetical protein
MKNHVVIACSILILITLGMAIPAFADYTYFYVGNKFTDVFGTEGYTTSDYLRGWISTPILLEPGHNYDFFSLPAFSLFDGHHTIDQSNATSEFFSFDVDSSGLISEWSVNLLSADVSMGTCNGNCVPSPVDFTYVFATQSGGDVADNPGHWFAEQVPEPSGMLMLTVGLAGVAARRFFALKA